MALTTFTSHCDEPEHSGCPLCREDYAAMLNETPTQTAQRLTAQSRRPLLQAFAAKHAATVLRAAATPEDDEPTSAEAWRDHFSRALDVPPDPYAAALDARREKAGMMPLTADLDKRYRPLGAPPDGYRIGLAARRLQQEVKATPTPTAAKPPVEMQVTSDGIPDGYATALAGRRR